MGPDGGLNGTSGTNSAATVLAPETDLPSGIVLLGYQP